MSVERQNALCKKPGELLLGRIRRKSSSSLQNSVQSTALIASALRPLACRGCLVPLVGLSYSRLKVDTRIPAERGESGDIEKLAWGYGRL
jgi:hypothetical protein